MPTEQSIPDLLQRTHEICGDEIIYRFANDLIIKAELLRKPDKLRVLGLGSPQGGLMNRLLNFPQIVEGKSVFEPFAGSGAIGFMALKAGAKRVDLLDINPRAVSFQRENAALNAFSATQFNTFEADIATYVPKQRYDVLLANPPFVPTPQGIEGTITSNGGPDGCRFVETLLNRLDEFLEPRGQALIYLFQLVADDQPLIAGLLRKISRIRSVVLTPSQRHPIPFEKYCAAYHQLFPGASGPIEHWRAETVKKHGSGLALCHYVLDIGPQSDVQPFYAIEQNFAERFGEGFLIPGTEEAIAYARVFENLLSSERNSSELRR
jgi:release factor glutamine methyltransferase